MMRKTILISSMILTVFLISCEKLLIEKDIENTPENNFELLWTTIDEKYSFFGYKNINWDSIYMVYRPKVNENTSDRQLFNILADMLLELRDGHVNLYSGFETSRYWEWYLNYPANFNIIMIRDIYFVPNFQKTGSFSSMVRDSIGYIYIASFADKISEKDLDLLIEQYYELKGLIIDVRDNSGGLSRNSNMIASRFADDIRLVSWYLYKNGPGHGDFTKPQPNYIRPEGKKQFTRPVVVLTNRKTYSATNDFVLNMSVFPHVTLMGDTTGGGGGTPYEYELLNGWRYRFPRTQTLSVDGFNVEYGIPPDIQVSLSRRDEDRGVDSIIEAAFRFIADRSF